MKNLLLILLVLLALSPAALASDWRGKTVLVPENALICDSTYIEQAMAHLSAGDKDPVIDFLKQGFCTQSPDPFFATVVTDTSSSGDYPMVEIVVEEASGWLAKSSPDCCYTQSNGEWVKEIRSIPEWKKACTPEEALQAFLDNQKRQGYLDAPPPPPEMAPVLRCPGEY